MLSQLNFFLCRGPSVRKKLVHQRRFICLGLLLCGLLCGIARADSFQLNDGTTANGDLVSPNENGVRFRQPDGNYSDVVPWTKFSQDDLKKFVKDPKLEPLVSPLIDESDEQRIQKTELPNPTQPRRLKRPASGSLFGAMISSSVGFFVLLVLYGAGIYAAYEVAIFRRRPKGLVCGLAAVPALGLLSPILFLAMPAQAPRGDEDEEEGYEPEPAAPAAQQASFAVPPAGTPAAQSSRPSDAAARPPTTSVPQPSPSESGGLKLSQDPAAPAPSNVPLPPPQVFQRGAFMFNRRFFETKFPGFFGVTRRDADKDMVLTIKAARGEYVVDRISRISANELHAQVRKGPATEEVMIPFSEVQEIRLKHKDSP